MTVKECRDKMATFSILCRLKNGCMGCCGHDFLSKEKIKEAVKKNTKEFKLFNPKTEEEFLKFRDRAHPDDLPGGVCRNLVEEKGRIFCPLHPSKHNGRDLREGHCDIDHLCRTAKEFSSWTRQKQKKFLFFVEEKKMDNIDYSLKMDDHALLKEFANGSVENKG